MLSSLLAKFYLMTGALVLLGYLVMESRGKVFWPSDVRTVVAPGARPSGGRTVGYVGGYRGGK